MNQFEKELKDWTTHMLENILTQAELKALAKNKGIVTKGVSKEGLVKLVLERFFIPDQISKVYEELPTDYQLLLHYLKANKEPLKIERAIEYLQDWENTQSRGFYTKAMDYRRLFSELKDNLAVKGLVVITEPSYYYSSGSKFERFGFYLPQAFHSSIPPLPVQGKRGDQEGISRSFEGFAKKILLSSLRLQDLKGEIEQKIVKDISWPKGILHFQNSPIFQADKLLRRIYSTWRQSKIYERYSEKIDVVTNLFYIFEGLPEGQWLGLSEIQELFGRLTRLPSLEEIKKRVPVVCDEAVGIGLLERMGPQTPSYRLQARGLALMNGSVDIARLDEGIYVEKDGSLRVDLNYVSIFPLLEILSISDWMAATDALFCSPSPIKCGKILRKFSNFSKLHLYEYLKGNSIPYRQTFQRVEEDFGKFMIHSRLSIFEVTDITISTLLRHTFPEIFYPVGGNFFAVSEENEGVILKFLEQKRYSVKMSKE